MYGNISTRSNWFSLPLLVTAFALALLAGCGVSYDTVTIAPTDLATDAGDWQTVRAGSHAPKQTVACADGHLYLTPVRRDTNTDFTYPGKGLWDYDGENWHEHFADDYTIVLCAPDGPVYAWVLEMEKYAADDYDAIVDPLYRRDGDDWVLVDAEANSEGIHGQLMTADHWASDANLIVDGQGDFWASVGLTYGNLSPGYGAMRFDGEVWHVVAPSSLRNRVMAMLRGVSDQVEYSGLSGWDVMDMEVGPDGTAWLFTAVNGFCSFDGDEWRRYPAIFDDDLAIFGVVDAQGGVWVNANEGVVYMHDGIWTYFRSDGSVSISPVAADPAGSVWFEESREGAADSLLRYDCGEWLRYEFPQGVERTDSPAYTSRRDAVVAADGALWLRGGLRFLPGGPRLESLPGD